MSVERAHLLMQHSRYELAEQELRQALAHDPNDPLSHATLGVCLSEQGREREAVEACRHAITLAPDMAFCHYALAAVLHDHDRYDQSAAAVEEAIRIDPYHADAHALRGQLHLHARDWKDAVTAAGAALAINAEHVGAANVQAIALTKLGRRDEAGLTLDAALARDPENAVTHANRGWALLHAREPKEAMVHFAEALRLDPTLEWARAGIVEAMKARNPIYRWLLAYFLWMSRLKGRVQFALIIGAYVLIQVLGGLAATHAGLDPYVTPIVIAYVAFVFLTWTAEPLFNLLLRLSRYGRHALSHEQTIASNWFGATVAIAALFAVAWAATGNKAAEAGAALTAILTLPVAGVFKSPTRGRRRLLAGYTVVMALLALLTVIWEGFLAPEGREARAQSWGFITAVLFFIMFIAYVWLANFLFLKVR